MKGKSQGLKKKVSWVTEKGGPWDPTTPQEWWRKLPILEFADLSRLGARGQLSSLESVEIVEWSPPQTSQLLLTAATVRLNPATAVEHTTLWLPLLLAFWLAIGVGRPEHQRNV